MAKRILIGYESGEHGQGALELGCALASALGAELVVGHVYAWDTYLAPAPDDSPLEEWHALLRRDAESLVAEALSRCQTETAPRGIAWASTSPARGLYELDERRGGLRRRPPTTASSPPRSRRPRGAGSRKSLPDLRRATRSRASSSPAIPLGSSPARASGASI